MIKLIIFDLDGVLTDSRDLHYEALNAALATVNDKYIISREEHLAKYDGLSTRRKLQMLTEEKQLPENKHDAIWAQKQKITQKIIDQSFSYDYRIRDILRSLGEKYYYILCVASNCIRESVKMILLRKGFIEYFNFFLSNEDVKWPKPSTEIYLRCMIKAGVDPSETLIIEDAHHARQAVVNSGAHLLGVRNPNDLKIDTILDRIRYINMKEEKLAPWQGGQMNVLIPMAGEGSRFEKAGYSFPKPLIEVNGKPMIELVVKNLNIDARHIFVVQKSHYDEFNLKYLLNLITNNNCEIIVIDEVTQGAACTALLAKELIDNDEPLLIANSDQFIEWNSNEFMHSMSADSIDGGILTFTATHPKWSFAQIDKNGFVTKVAEKVSISNIATVGLYYWTKGKDYVAYAEQMIQKNIRTKNEFYVAPAYNEAIADMKKIKRFHIEKMWGLGTPEDLEYFLRNYKVP